MYLQSDGSDRKIISQQTDYRRICRGWMRQTMFYPKVYSSAADSLSGGLWCLFRKLIFKETNCFYPIIIMLDVIRTKPWHHGCTPSTPMVSTLDALTVRNDNPHSLSTGPKGLFQKLSEYKKPISVLSEMGFLLFSSQFWPAMITGLYFA